MYLIQIEIGNLFLNAFNKIQKIDISINDNSLSN